MLTITTVKDLAILAQALIRDYPNEYKWYQENPRYGGITQQPKSTFVA